MVKETAVAAPAKKKRKATSQDTEANVDIYQKICDYESKEAQASDITADSKTYMDTVESIHTHIEALRVLKLFQKQGTADYTEKVQTHMAGIVVNICLLKQLNRVDKLKQVIERDALNVEKQKCDSIKLNYQNLVYELHHLVTETNKCLAFKSEDENIELVTLEEFLEHAPEEVTKPFQNLDENDTEQAHSLRLARLEWELTQRKNVAEECKLLEEKKKQVVAEILERRAKLNDLLPLLNAVIKAAKPLQEHLGLSGDLPRTEHVLANLLPDPLYILYANLVAYKSVFESTLDITISGDKDDAVQFNEAQEVANSNGFNDDDSEHESDLPEVEEVVEVVKKRRHRKSAPQVDPIEEKKKKLLEVHPLKVEITFAVENGPKLTITFSYFTKLRLVTVNSKENLPAQISANTAREILSGENILSELLDNDTGLESPNPNTGYLLKKIGLGSFQSLMSDIGFSYRWAQSICGINFLTPKKYCENQSQHNVEVIMKIIRKRLNNRTHLARQMQQLEQNILPSIPDTIATPLTHVSQLNKWISITYQDFCQAQFTESLINDELVSSSDLYYSAKITRAEATLQALIVIKNTYPSPAPIFVLNLIYKGNHSSTNNDEIRDMERSINVGWENKSKSSAWLLSAQLTHLCSYLDVYLESVEGSDFPQNTKFIRPISGRNRRRPFKFKKIGTGIFSQY